MIQIQLQKTIIYAHSQKWFWWWDFSRCNSTGSSWRNERSKRNWIWRRQLRWICTWCQQTYRGGVIDMIVDLVNIFDASLNKPILPVTEGSSYAQIGVRNYFAVAFSRCKTAPHSPVSSHKFERTHWTQKGQNISRGAVWTCFVHVCLHVCWRMYCYSRLNKCSLSCLAPFAWGSLGKQVDAANRVTNFWGRLQCLGCSTMIAKSTVLRNWLGLKSFEEGSRELAISSKASGRKI